MADRDGWARVVPGVYAKGAYRIQRGAKGWYWNHVVQITPDHKGGVERTLSLAKSRVQLAEFASQRESK